jgi:hypothetical protein
VAVEIAVEAALIGGIGHGAQISCLAAAGQRADSRQSKTVFDKPELPVVLVLAHVVALP